MSAAPYTRPPALRKGSKLAVLSPASTPRADRVQRGISELHQMGYATVLGQHALDRGPLYFAGTLHQRVADLHAAFADPSVDGILCTRGGWGSAELLPHLDAQLIRANPKPFVGYSDHTSLHLWLQQEAGLVTFHGPMVAADFAREDGYHAASWTSALHDHAAWSIGAAEGLRVLRPGHASGTLRGGCLSLLAEACGTSYAMRPGPGILFLEDIGTKPYQWDRMLLHLRYAGLLDSITGIVFGDMRQCVTPEENALLEAAILHGLGDFSGPVAIGLRSGHVHAPNVTLPLGVPAELDLTDKNKPALSFLAAEKKGQGI